MTHSIEPAPTIAPSKGLIALLAISCGLIVGNIYYAQPLVGLIGPQLGLASNRESLIVTATMLGYAVGLLFIVPLGDIVENRRLLVLTVSASVPALLLAGSATGSHLFLAAAALTGLTSAGVQMLLPLAAHLAPDRIRGRIIGNVMVGLLVGILIARPVSSLMAAAFGWRAIFFLSAGLMALLAIILRIALPERHPRQHHRYRDLIASLIEIPAKTPLLRRRGLYQAAAFAGFSTFWTAVPLLLARRFEFSQRGIALFALIGVSGALVAPIAGRLADRNLIRPGTICCLLLIALSFLIAAWGGLAGHSVGALLVAAVLLDAGVQANMVLSQRELYALSPSIYSRVNGVFIAIFFTAGALGSSLVSPVLGRAGWLGICLLGTGLALAALGYVFTDPAHAKPSRRSPDQQTDRSPEH